MILTFPKAFYRHRELWWRLTEREILGRYRGSFLGLGWSVLNPLAMLAVYTFVFSHVFKARWGNLEHTGALGFAINLFAGLIVFNLFSECLNRAPVLVLSNPNYVKKVIFPLEILGGVSVANSCFHAMASLCVLMVFEVALLHGLPITYIWLPLVWLPLVLGCLGLTWLLAGLGVFLRDIGQFISVALSMLMFLSPVFYPATALPKKFQALIFLSPLTHVIEQTRSILIAGKRPSFSYLAWGLLAGIIIAELGFRFFQKARRAFADVI